MEEARKNQVEDPSEGLMCLLWYSGYVNEPNQTLWIETQRPLPTRSIRCGNIQAPSNASEVEVKRKEESAGGRKCRKCAVM